MTDDDAVTADALLHGRVRLYQPARGARMSLDPVLLAGFVAPPFGRFLDIGCGTGPISFLLLAGDPAASGVGVEIQPRLAALAVRGRDDNGWEPAARDHRRGRARARREVGRGDVRSGGDQSALPDARLEPAVAEPGESAGPPRDRAAAGGVGRRRRARRPPGRAGCRDLARWSGQGSCIGRSPRMACGLRAPERFSPTPISPLSRAHRSKRGAGSEIPVVVEAAAHRPRGRRGLHARGPDDAGRGVDVDGAPLKS